MTMLLFADSTNRDATLYPSGNSYTLHLTRPIKNIERVDLVSARVPNTMYNLTNGTNVLNVNGSPFSLNPGFYTAYGLATAITNVLSSSPTLTYLTDEGHFMFSSSSGPFTFQIQTTELALMLGFSQGVLYQANSQATSSDPVFAGQWIYRSPTLVDFSVNDYVFLDIDELRTPAHVDTGSLQGQTGTISGSNANRNFAPVIMDVNSSCIKNFHENKDYRVQVEYPEPISSLQRLTVRWVDKSGNLLDFRGWNSNAFILRIHVREDDERRLPPPPPLQDVEIKRIVEAMTIAVPKSEPEKKRMKIPWWFIIGVLIIAAFAYKTFYARVTA